jgi:hypothetical protein
MKSTALFQKISKWLLLTTSVFTMVMMPVTEGQAAQTRADEISKNQVQNALTTLGLNKSMTLGEFYKKNKYLYPVRIQKMIEKFVALNKDYVMPQFELMTVKNTQGNEIPTVRISKDAELVSLQIYGNSDKYVKFNNTNLTEVDIVNFTDMLLKINNHEPDLRQQIEDTNRPVTKFTGFPAVSKSIWKNYSAKDKAEYILNMRRLWADAQKVLILQDPKLKRKTSQFEYFLNTVFNDAFAAQRGHQMGPKVNKHSGTTANASSKNCLVAGYVSHYSNGSCGVSAVQDSYKDATGTVDETITKAQSQCTGGEIACNPYIYGMPNGKAICANIKSPEFQIATHANGPCDTASPLGTEVQFLNQDLKNNKRYDAENIKMNSDELKAEFQKQQKNNSSYVENYLKGFLDAGVDFNAAIDDKVLDQILNVKKAFDNDISKAKDSCIAAAKTNQRNEKNFWGACDQLQRRFLFVAEFLSEKPGCKDSSVMNPETLKCTCTDANKTEVNPGAKCSVEAAKPPESKPPTESEAKPPTEKGPSKNEKIMEPGDECDGTIEANANGAQVCISNIKPDLQGKKVKEKDSWWLNLFKQAVPWIIGGIALYAMYKLWSPKKPVLNQPLDTCPNGVARSATVPCAQACEAPKSQVNGSCACAECVPVIQYMSNLATCTCSTVTTSTTTPTTVTCADGVTQVTTLSSCPATVYTCWDNTKVTNPINCPVQPASNPATKPVDTSR